MDNRKGAGTVEGSVFKARRIGDQMHGRNATRENEEVGIGRRQEVEGGTSLWETIRILYKSHVY